MEVARRALRDRIQAYRTPGFEPGPRVASDDELIGILISAATEAGAVQMKERAKLALRSQRDRDPRDIGSPYASALSVAVDIVDRLPVKP